jgi:2-keto-4-pentenoate hydratase/2-oxohepta-3-ene-1,7-dioic acid hydratase in catechol pathway
LRPQLIEAISAGITLASGAIIAAGTPSGVGIGVLENAVH